MQAQFEFLYKAFLKQKGSPTENVPTSQNFKFLNLFTKIQLCCLTHLAFWLTYWSPRKLDFHADGKNTRQIKPMALYA